MTLTPSGRSGWNFMGRTVRSESLRTWRGAARARGVLHRRVWLNSSFPSVSPHLARPSENVLKPIAKSSKLANVCYDIRGPVLEKARQMEEDGHKIIKLNIGNLAVFGLEPPDEIVQDMIRNLSGAAGYTDSKGLFAPRKSVVHYCQEKGIKGVTVDDVYLGNGASELIVMAINALCNEDDEVLLPAPDYPLYTAAVSLSGGRPVPYICDEQQVWYPDIADIRAKITPRTRAIVVINPNNPTGALYPESLLKEIVEVAREHQLIILADEIYDKTLFDGNTHTSIASLAEDVLCLTFNGLSKNYRSCGYRAGWMVVSGEKRHARDYIEGLNMLASMRLCANTPGQLAIQTALGGYQSIKDLVQPGGRLCKQRDLAYELLAEEKVLIVQGTGFNWTHPDHFRLVFLPNSDD